MPVCSTTPSSRSWGSACFRRDAAEAALTAIVAVRGLVQGRSDKINRVGYLLSDLRRGDWATEGGEAGGKYA